MQGLFTGAGRRPITGKSVRRAARTHEATETAAFWLFIVGLAWVPFWYGSNVLIAWGINAVLFPGIAAVYEISLLTRGKPHPVAIRHVALPTMLFAAVVVWVWFQTVTWAHSPLSHPIWTMTAKALGRPVRGSISVDRDLTNLALLRLITAASVFWIALQLCRNGVRASRFVMSIAAIGGIYAAYGLIAAKTGQLPWLRIPADGKFVSSTFYNRDSYASYAGLGLVAAAGIMIQVFSQGSGGAGNWRHRLASAIGAVGTAGVLPLAGAFLTLVALLMTGSRGGIIATGLGLALLGALAYRQSDRRGSERLAPLFFGFLLVAATLLSFGGILAGKLDESGVSDPNRLAVYVLTLRSIADKPFLGFGYGTFRDVFPMYRDRSLSVQGVWEQAHNTYLEVFQGLGVVFGAMLILCVLLLVLRCVRGSGRRRESAMVPRVAAGAACLVGVHALVDFSLQIQAVALTFIAMLGAGVAQSESSRLPLED